jgi:hypothetical protein
MCRYHPLVVIINSKNGSFKRVFNGHILKTSIEKNKIVSEYAKIIVGCGIFIREERTFENDTIGTYFDYGSSDSAHTVLGEKRELGFDGVVNIVLPRRGSGRGWSRVGVGCAIDS